MTNPIDEMNTHFSQSFGSDEIDFKWRDVRRTGEVEFRIRVPDDVHHLSGSNGFDQATVIGTGKFRLAG